jgi:hypothetical protein
MGFWMQFVRPSTGLPDWYEPVNPDYPDLYSLTFGGMFEVAAGMAAAGLLDEEKAAPTLPRYADVGLGEERGQELFDLFVYRPTPGQRTLDDVLTPEERPAFTEYLARFEAATGQPAPPGKALAYKFRTNDGWLVTPDECRVIADVLDAALAKRRARLVRGLQARGYSRTRESVADLLSPWAKYNRVAADHTGYRIW